MKATIRRWLHQITHRMGWQHGTVVTWFAKDKSIMVGFQCSECGQIDGAHPVRFQISSPNHSFLEGNANPAAAREGDA